MRESWRTRVEMHASEVALAIAPMSRWTFPPAGVMSFNDFGMVAMASAAVRSSSASGAGAGAQESDVPPVLAANLSQRQPRRANRSGRGDQIVKLNLKVPKRLSRKQKRLLEDLKSQEI